jgi:hypothetical protein
MPSPLKKVHTQIFTGGKNTDLAAEYVPNNVYRYMLNCNVLSTADGNVGVVTNIKGNKVIEVNLPNGINKTRGVALDEENNRMYFAVWNSEGYHSWYRYDYITNKVTKVIQCRTDTNDVDIFKWQEHEYIWHADIVNNNLLYWVMKGHPPRKINIDKAMDKSPAGYGHDISELFTRAYKRAGVYSPDVEYFTDTTKRFNLLYRRQFKFAYRWIYDDNEKSDWSDWSAVPNPTYESFLGEATIPDENNGIMVYIETGPSIVVGIEIAVQTILDDGSLSPWMLVDSLNKRHSNISDENRYGYKFYNEGSYSPVDQAKIFRKYSNMPRDPATQSFTKNAIVYGHFTEGFDPVDIDVSWDVEYNQIYFDDPVTDENDPSITYNQLGTDRDKGRHATIGEFIIGPDVKRGNVFEVEFLSVGTPLSNTVKAGQLIRQTLRVVAMSNDDARSIASKLANQLRTIQSGPSDHHKKSYVRDIVSYGGGSFGFQWRHRTSYQASYWIVNVKAIPVETAVLEDNGQSVRIIKNGSSAKYGIEYYDEDGVCTAVQSNDSLIVAIKSANDLNAICSPNIKFSINHRPPPYARYWSLVRTKDLVFDRYIYLLAQRVVEIEHDSGEKFWDISLGSLYTYQRIHPNTTLKYDFKAGDRIRAMYERDSDDDPFVIVQSYKDFEILSFSPIVTTVINENIVVDGSNKVVAVAPKTDHIGSFIRIDGVEREIIGVDGDSYELEDDIATGSTESTRTFPTYEIINKRGVLRVAADDFYPISGGSIVQIYSPASQTGAGNDEIFHSFGKKFNIINPGTPEAYHEGNIQNQTDSIPAIVSVTEGSAYARQRAFPLNNSETNTQIAIGLVEDASYSDFYHSDMTDDGKANALDLGHGVVKFDSRLRWSNNYIEGTRINGLNDFDNLDREDYNDQYGAIVRTIFANGRLYVFKHLKCAYATVYANRITQADGNTILATSDRLLPRMLEYFLWDGGIGDNPGGVTRSGNNFFFVSPDSGIVGIITYNGVEPISVTYNVDSEIRKKIALSKSSNAPMITWFDRKSGNYELTFTPHDILIYQGEFVQDDWDIVDDSPQMLDMMFYGINTTGVLPDVADIESSLNITFNDNGVTVPFEDNGSPRYYWIAYLSSNPLLGTWQDPDNLMNVGSIGTQGGLFRQFQNVGPYRVAITRYPTQMNSMIFKV